MSLAPSGHQSTTRPAHLVAALRYSGPSAVAFVDCACDERVESIAAWYAHLRTNGQQPELSNIGPPREDPLRRLSIK